MRLFLNLLNQCLDDGIFPENFKEAYVRTVIKKINFEPEKIGLIPFNIEPGVPFQSF